MEPRAGAFDLLGCALIAIMFVGGLRMVYVLFVSTVAALWGFAP